MFRHGKPLSSKTGQKLYPICYVDSSIKTAGPPLSYKQCIRVNGGEEKDTAGEEEPDVDLMHQSRKAFSQWGCGTERTSESWLKSWYFPMDAFMPWPHRTDIACWWCTYQFDWTPFPLPYQYDTSSNRYRTIGMFCGPSCAKSYAVHVKHFSNLDNVFCWIETIATDLYGYRIQTDEGAPLRSAVPLAPSKELLQKYCGPEGMTIEEFRNSCLCGRKVKLLDPCWITQKQVVQAEQLVARKGKGVYHRENPDDIQRTQDLVRVHRIPFAGLGARRLTDYMKPRS